MLEPRVGIPDRPQALLSEAAICHERERQRSGGTGTDSPKIQPYMRLLAVAIFASILAGCGGGGGVAPSSSAAGSAQTPDSLQQVKMRLVISNGSTATSAAAQRRAQFVSTSTQGLFVQVYAHTDTGHSNLLASTIANISSTSPACATSSSGLACFITVPAPAGTDDFVLTTYDQAPTTAAQPFANANVLAVGAVTATIVLNTTNTLSVALGGVIKTVQLAPQLAAQLSGSQLSYALTVNGLDADQNIIIAGTADPYSTPIALSISNEASGSGHTLLSLNGSAGPGSTSLQLTQSSQAVTVLFDGVGVYPYVATITGTAGSAAPGTAQFNAIDIVRATPTTLSFTSTTSQSVQFAQLGALAGATIALSSTCQPGAAITFTPASGLATGFPVTVTAVSAPTTPSSTPACTLTATGVGTGAGSFFALPVNIATTSIGISGTNRSVSP